MFSGSSGELALIFLLTLLVFGPERLPGLARNFGKLVRRSRILVHSVWNQLEEEIDRSEKNQKNKTNAAVLEREAPVPSSDGPDKETQAAIRNTTDEDAQV